MTLLLITAVWSTIPLVILVLWAISKENPIETQGGTQGGRGRGRGDNHDRQENPKLDSRWRVIDTSPKGVAMSRMDTWMQIMWLATGLWVIVSGISQSVMNHDLYMAMGVDLGMSPEDKQKFVLAWGSYTLFRVMIHLIDAKVMLVIFSSVGFSVASAYYCYDHLASDQDSGVTMEETSQAVSDAGRSITDAIRHSRDTNVSSSGGLDPFRHGLPVKKWTVWNSLSPKNQAICKDKVANGQVNQAVKVACGY